MVADSAQQDACGRLHYSIDNNCESVLVSPTLVKQVHCEMLPVTSHAVGAELAVAVGVVPLGLAVCRRCVRRSLVGGEIRRGPVLGNRPFAPTNTLRNFILSLALVPT